LIRVVDCAIDSVTEPELAGEVDGQPSRGELVIRFLDGGDEPAAITASENGCDFLLEVQAFLEDQGWHR